MRAEDELLLEACRFRGRADWECSLAGVDLDWERVLETAARHRVAPTALESLTHLALPDARAEWVRRRYKEVARRALLRAGTLRAALDEAAERLGSDSIEFVLLKGLSVDPGSLRTMGDLDLLVRPDDLRRALASFEAAGYEEVGGELNRLLTRDERRDLDRQRSWNNQYQLHDHRTGVLVELHTNLFERERVYPVDLAPLLDRVDELWDGRVRAERLGCDVLSAEHQLLTLCLHSALKFSPARNAFLLRAHVDIDTLATRELDWDSFVESAARLRVAPFVHYALRMTRRLLGTDVPERAAEALAARCSGRELRMERLHARCFVSLSKESVFARHVYRAACPFVYRGSRRDKLAALLQLRVLFPARWRMAQIFGVPEGSPLIYLTYVLNPLRWAAKVLRRWGR